jgi:catechol 2,3-dioxygenase-like lactoylglutathione lyase family enzyme
MKIISADHTSYTVADIERSLAFYVGLLGCEVLWQREITEKYFCDIVCGCECRVLAAHLQIPGSDHHLELFQYLQPEGEKADVRPFNTGSSHISFVVEDLQAAYEELRSQGVKFRSPPVLITAGANRGGWGVYMEDPDGIIMELFQRP